MKFIFNSNFQNKQALFAKEQRKEIYSFLVRALLKEAYKLKPFDEMIFQYILSEVRNKTELYKNISNLNKIKIKLEYGYNTLEDLRKINQNFQKDEVYQSDSHLVINYS